MQRYIRVSVLGYGDVNCDRNLEHIMMKLKEINNNENTWILLDYQTGVIVNQYSRLEDIQKLVAINTQNHQQIFNLQNQNTLLTKRIEELENKKFENEQLQLDLQNIREVNVQRMQESIVDLEKIKNLNQKIRELNQEIEKLENKLKDSNIEKLKFQEAVQFNIDLLGIKNTKIDELSSEIKVKNKYIQSLSIEITQNEQQSKQFLNSNEETIKLQQQIQEQEETIKKMTENQNQIVREKEQQYQQELLEQIQQFQNEEQLKSKELQNCQQLLEQEQLKNKELLEQIEQNEKKQQIQQQSNNPKLMETQFNQSKQEKLKYVKNHLMQFLEDDDNNKQEEFLGHLQKKCSDLIYQLRKAKNLNLCNEVSTSIEPVHSFYIYFNSYDNYEKVPKLNYFRQILWNKQRIEKIHQEKTIQQKFLVKVMIDGQFVWFCRKSYDFNLLEQEAEDIIFNYLIAYEYMKKFAIDLQKDPYNNNYQQNFIIKFPKLLLVRNSNDSFSVFIEYFENTAPQSYKQLQAQKLFDKYINSFCLHFFFSMNKNLAIDEFEFETQAQNQSQEIPKKDIEIIFKSAVINSNFAHIFSVLDKGVKRQYEEKFDEGLPEGATQGFWSKTLEDFAKQNWSYEK